MINQRKNATISLNDSAFIDTLWKQVNKFPIWKVSRHELLHHPVFQIKPD